MALRILGAILAMGTMAALAQPPLIIAHRGASAYLPEHTLPAKALAHAQGADFIEQDVVLSRDGVPVVLHDIHLDGTTDVAQHFPARAREDGRFYAIDFSLAELRTLRAGERRGSDGQAVFPERFPDGPAFLPIPTLEEEIRLITGLNRTREHQAGLYIEMKGSAFHRDHGMDLPAAVLAVLRATGWDLATDRVFLQSFEPDALRHLRQDLASPLPLIQLIGENSWQEDGAADYDFLRTPAGLDSIASYADGIGPWIPQLYRADDDGNISSTGLVEAAHARSLAVHPYTARADALPPGIGDFAALHRLLFAQLGVDGIFTDFPDRSRDLREQLRSADSAP